MTLPKRRRSTRTANPTRAIGYLRVSTEEQTLGPDAQRGLFVGSEEGGHVNTLFVSLRFWGLQPVDNL